MFGKSCSLCGSRLNSSGICIECGLDNKKTDAKYVINKSDCDRKPLTHVHEERQADWKKKPSSTKRSMKEYNSYYKKRIILIVSIVIGFYLVIGIVAGIVYKISDSGMSMEEELLPDMLDDPYTYVTREIPPEGEEYSTVLGQGEYVVGIHIPEGIYMCTANGGYASFDVQDEENNIWLYEWVDENQPEYIDLRLYEGAILEVMGDTPLMLYTTNSQGGLRYNSNPLGERTAYIASGAVAGEAFEPGVYMLRAEEGYGQVIVEIVDEGGTVIEWKYLWMDAEDDMEGRYANLVLPEGAIVSWEDYEGLRVSLVSSEPIATENYLGYYGY